jgi:thymidylate synthase
MDMQKLRLEFYKKYLDKDYVTDKTGSKVIEVIGASFVADEETLFGKVNESWVKREIDWYNTLSLNVNDIEGEVPKLWREVAAADGDVNSNYGWCVFSPDNYNQYGHVVAELVKNPQSRRACIIYTRPEMHLDYRFMGKNDFICTHAVNYTIRDDVLNVVVQMRSNDAVFGYNNDRYWQMHIARKLAEDLDLDPDKIHMIWQAASLHVYERHFDKVKGYFNG